MSVKKMGMLGSLEKSNMNYVEVHPMAAIC